MPVVVNRRPSWLQFAVWAWCGATAALALLAAFAWGPLAIAPAAVAAGLAVLIGGANVSAVGAVAGVGTWGLPLAWLNRGGPGDVCHAMSGGSQCDQESAPWPFVVAALVVVGVSVTMFVVVRRRAR
jgi:hypothetical protein